MPYKTRDDKLSILIFKDTAAELRRRFGNGYDNAIRKALKLPPREETKE